MDGLLVEIQPTTLALVRSLLRMLSALINLFSVLAPIHQSAISLPADSRAAIRVIAQPPPMPPLYKFLLGRCPRRVDPFRCTTRRIFRYG